MVGYSNIGIWEVVSLGISVLLLISAKSLNEPVLAEFSAIIAGAALGTILSKMSLKELVEKTNELVERITIPSCTSEEEEIKNLRKRMYLYYVTTKDGKEAWRCVTVDFSRIIIPNRLETIVTTIENNKEFRYKLVGFVRRSRLVIYTEPINSKEESAICIFPFLGKEYEWVNEAVPGIHIGETWDHKTIVSPALITDSPIEKQEDGFVKDDLNDKLTSMWSRNIIKETEISERIILPKQTK